MKQVVAAVLFLVCAAAAAWHGALHISTDAMWAFVVGAFLAFFEAMR